MEETQGQCKENKLTNRKNIITDDAENFKYITK